MATKKKAAAPKKKAAAKKGTAPKKKAEGTTVTLKSIVDDCVIAGMKNAEILAKLQKDKIEHSEKSVRWYASKARLAAKDAA